MGGLTEHGGARLLGAWTGQLPPPALYASLVGDVKGAGLQRLLLDDAGWAFKKVRFGPAPAGGWSIRAVDIIDETGLSQSRTTLPAPMRIVQGMSFEWKVTARTSDDVTERGALRLFGAWCGQLPPPDLFVRPVGWVPGLVRQRLRLDTFGSAGGARVTFGPADPEMGARISAFDIEDEAGERQARVPLDDSITLEPSQTLTYEIAVHAAAVDG